MGKLYKHKFILGDGRDILFWEDTWIGDQCFKENFPRLYRLEDDKEAKVCDQIRWIDSIPQISWNWSPPPFGRGRDDLEMITVMISSYSNTETSQQKWRWNTSGDGLFYTKILTNTLDEKLFGHLRNDAETVFNKLIPKSISIFIWRAMRRRLPVRVELDNKECHLGYVHKMIVKSYVLHATMEDRVST
ncbi:uncharacterized protein [Rutidosis leptorrhynchoides]|uniref:uncharacterized protein n=1 Tax=Rutidosis leptorrhynchoides TaxID=125765 RepID=UPI003A99AA3D